MYSSKPGQTVVTLGRSPTNDVAVGQGPVSASHATLEQRDGKVFFRDHRWAVGALLLLFSLTLQSTNGSAVNGVLLKNGEVEVTVGARPVLMALMC